MSSDDDSVLSPTTSEISSQHPDEGHAFHDKTNDPEAQQKALDLKEKGNQQLLAGKFLDAIQFYSDGLDYDPMNAVILSNRAQAFMKVENFGLAIQDADKAIQADPEYAKAYYRRASANYALNHFKKARKDFRMVCQLKPRDRDARSKLAVCEKAVKEELFFKAIEAEQAAPLSDTYEPNAISIKGYEGPHPAGEMSGDLDEETELFQPGHLPRDFVLASIQWMKDQKSIPKRYVAKLLIACKRYFENLSSLIEIDVPSEVPASGAAPHLTVCGDTHGQFYDVLNIFELNGFPERSNPYLFNGDFVDRGSFSVEVILTYLLFKLSDPECIHLTRGNHETRAMNKIYGFEGEVKHKYDDKIFQLFLEVFEWMPLAAIVGGKVFVTHGGIPTDPSVMMDDIRKISRGTEPPENGLMSDLLWSDPQPFPGKSPSKRGVGFAFGPDIAHAFLERNGLELLVRSHEVKEEGYLVEHAGKTITVFSAPNYCDSMGNKGAFVHFDATLEPKYTQYEAVPHPPIKPMAYAAGMGGMF